MDWHGGVIGPEESIRTALLRLGKSRLHILLVVDGDGLLLGTVTDGDFRRGILRSVSLDAPLSEIMNRTPVTVNEGVDRKLCSKMMRKHEVQQLPVVDCAGKVVGLVRLEDLAAEQCRSNWVVLMAGGLGERLRPYTETVPKPLLAVGGRPILETIIAELSSHGLNRFYLSVNYRAEMVKEHFGDGARFGVEIRYLEENCRMGTAGPLSLVEERHDAPLLVMNGDVLTKLHVGHLLDYHDANQAAATSCVRVFEMQVPFGVVQLEDNRITGLTEKPVQEFMVNAGIYVIDPEVVHSLPREPLDMPDLLRGLIVAEHKVLAYPIHEYWMDVGQPHDFLRARSEFQQVFK